MCRAVGSGGSRRGLSASCAPPPDGARRRAGPAPWGLPRPRVSPSACRPRACHLQPPRQTSPAVPAPPPAAAAAAAAAWGIGPQTPAPDPRPDPRARGPWPARGTAASRWPSGRDRRRGWGRARRGSGFVLRGRGAGGRTPEPAPREEGPAWARQEGAVRWTGCRRRSAAGGLLEGGFVWVVISGPSWEPLMIRKSNKQGNPVFHTQPWPRPERLCVSSSPTLGAAVSYWDIGGGGIFPSSTPVG